MKGMKNDKERLFRQATKLEEEHKYEEAIRIYLQLKNQIDNDRESSIDQEILLRLGKCELWRIKFDDAIKYLNQINDSKASLETKLEKYIIINHSQISLGNSSAAFESMKIAYNIVKKEAEAHPVLKGKVMTLFANISLYESSSIKKAIEILEESLSILTAADENLPGRIGEIIRAHYILLKGNYYFGTIELATKHYNQGLAWIKKMTGKTDWPMYFHNIYASYILSQKSIAKAIETLKKSDSAGANFYQDAWEGHERRFSIVLSMATFERKRGDYFEALNYIKSVQKRLVEGKIFEGGRGHMESAYIYYEMGNYKLALQHARKAYFLIKRKSDRTVNLLDPATFLGKILAPINSEESRKYFNEALSICEKKNSKIDYHFIWLGIFAVCEKEQIDEYIKRAEAFCDYQSNSFILVSSIYYEIAKRLSKEKDKRAVKYFEMVLGELLTKEKFDFNSEIDWENDLLNYKLGWDCICGLGDWFVNASVSDLDNPENHLIKAEKYYEISLRLLELNRNSYSAERSKLFFGEQLNHTFGNAIYIQECLNRPDKESKIFHFIEKSKAGMLKQEMMEGRAKLLLKDTAYFNNEKELRDEIITLEMQFEEAKEKKGQDADQRFKDYFNKRLEYKEFIKKVESEIPEYKNLKYQDRTFTLQEIQSGLNEDQKILSYFIHQNSLKIFVLSDFENEIVNQELPRDFEHLVTEFIQSINTIDAAKSLKLGLQLYQLLILPIEDLIQDVFDPAAINQLIIIPHSFLSKIPFEALVKLGDVNKIKYLVESYDIVYHYSASLWFEQTQRGISLKPKSFVGFAPVYSPSRKAASHAAGQVDVPNVGKEIFSNSGEIAFEDNTEELAHLPFSEVEVKDIADLFSKHELSSRIFLNEQANRKNLLRESAKCSILHLAAHFIQNENNKLSGLALANGEKFYIQEAFTIALEADTVVLSACESALGETYKNEGMMAINRGLFYSGASNVISTLFKVSDELSYKIMLQFYRNLLDGQKVVTALANVKRSLIKNPDLATKYWAAFVLFGQ